MKNLHSVSSSSRIPISNKVYSELPAPNEVTLAQDLLLLKKSKDELELELRAELADARVEIERQRESHARLRRQLRETRESHVTSIAQALAQERETTRVSIVALELELATQRRHQRVAEIWNRRFGSHQSESKFNNDMRHPEDPVRTSTSTPRTTSRCHDIMASFGQQLALLPRLEGLNIIRMGVLPFFTQLLRECHDDRVLGPALLVLGHISLYRGADEDVSQNARHLMGANASTIASLVYILDTSVNPTIVAASAQVLASLALYPPNKSLISAAHGVSSLLRHIVVSSGEGASSSSSSSSSSRDDSNSNSRDDNDDDSMMVMNPTHEAEANEKILMALVNLTQDSGMIQTQVGTLDRAIECLVDLVEDTKSCLEVKLQGIRVLVNVAQTYAFNQQAILSLRGDAVVLAQIQTSLAEIIQKTTQDNNDDHHYELIAAGFRCLSNLCQTQVNRVSIGYTDVVDAIVTTCADASTPFSVISAASLTVASLCYDCALNKLRFGSAALGPTLLDILEHRVRRVPVDDDSDDDALVEVQLALCKALTCFCTLDGNKRVIDERGGAEILAQCYFQVVKDTTETTTLPSRRRRRKLLLARSYAMALASLLPSPVYLREKRQAQVPLAIETSLCMDVFVHFQDHHYHHHDDDLDDLDDDLPPPPWLAWTRRALQCTLAELEAQQASRDWYGEICNTQHCREEGGSKQPELYDASEITCSTQTWILPDAIVRQDFDRAPDDL